MRAKIQWEDHVQVCLSKMANCLYNRSYSFAEVVGVISLAIISRSIAYVVQLTKKVQNACICTYARSPHAHLRTYLHT